ncbi:MAG: DUF1385 domain-containing protein, partial [Clostridia bacterium]|nr:DUF1385 domain-containing protein [Clostridia bacterium]
MSEHKSCPRVDIGGQAVMEGVMMKAPDAIAITVRRPDGTMVVQRKEYTPASKKHKWMAWPIIRGVINMGSMLSMGMGTLEDSMKMLGDAYEEEPSRFEKWLAEKLGKNIDKVVMGVAIVLAVVLALGMFVALPAGVEALTGALLGWSETAPAVAEGVEAAVETADSWKGVVVTVVGGLTKIIILIAYMYLCGLVPDVRRTFQYHGAEHKTVYCNENDLPLTPENAAPFTTLHPRCGTAFMFIVMFISMVLFLFVGRDIAHFFPRFLLHLALLPVVAGVSYEVLKGLAHTDNWFTRAARWPGLQMQRLTTKEPDMKMLEVAIVSMNVALHGMPENAPMTEEGWAVLTDYRQSEKGYAFTDEEKAAIQELADEYDDDDDDD